LIICYACITCPIARCRSQFHWQKLFDVQKNHYLTVRQQRFVAEFMLTGNGAEAARRAGYSVRTARQIASENLTKPVIQTALAAQEAILAREMDLSKERVIGELQATIEDARRQANPGAVIRGWVEIAKMVGLYEPQQAEVALGAGSERLRAKFEAMSDDELMAITRL
jgi:hypothetical protein